MTTFNKLPSYLKLKEYSESFKSHHLRELLNNEKRNSSLVINEGDIYFDFTRQRIDSDGIKLLLDLAADVDLEGRKKMLFDGQRINVTENRSVLHTALRSKSHQPLFIDNDFSKNILQEVSDVRNRVFKFANKIRSGELCGSTGKQLKDVVCIGIGGSYLGAEFVYEALKTTKAGVSESYGRRLRFLANIDPIDVSNALSGLIPETTLVIIISKTFTTAETIMNANILKEWLLKSLKTKSNVSKHLVAVSTNIKETTNFGIQVENVFGFWDWVGGRFSVCSAVGLLPLSIQFGPTIIQEFLDGCWSMDQHFLNTPLSSNIPVIMGLLSIYNSEFMDVSCVSVLPYCQALSRFPAFIQQLLMESNGKGTTLDGQRIDNMFKTGCIYFGEPGTNSQHSFFQLLHQGINITNCEFIGFIKSQNDIRLPSSKISSHDELMSNFFAQPDALALGKTESDLRDSGCPENLINHRIFPGNRTSIMILLPECNPFHLGQLLSIYEHRTAVEGFLLNINSFDQFGVELGKVLAKDIKNVIESRKINENNIPENELKLIGPTRRILDYYIKNRKLL